MSDFAKEPAPDATGKCEELVTAAWNCTYPCYGHFTLKEHEAKQATEDGASVEELVTRSQADEVLAAERARYVEASQRATNEESLRDTMHRGLRRWKERAEKAEADNAALTARIKELEERIETENLYQHEALEENDDRAEALEAKLAAAQEVAQLVIQAEEDKSGDPNLYILLIQTAYDKARAVLGGKPS